MSDALSTRLQQQLVLSSTGSSSGSLDFEAVIVEILSWLPAKSLLRFRCVCKTWRVVISDPYFIRKHLNRVSRSYSLLVKENSVFRSIDCETLSECSSHDDGFVPSRELYFPELEPLIHFYVIDIVGSCNGLVCLLLDWSTSIFMLWNPCTGECKLLPRLPIKNLPKFYGFGYDSITEDYKVIVGHFCGDEYDVVAFTLKTGSWRKLESLNHNYRVLWYGCLVNNALHWVLNQRDEDDRVIASKLVSFDLAEEKFHEIASPYSPDPIDRCNLVARAGNPGNSLALYCGHSTSSELDFRMWVMEEYGVEKSWNEVFRIPKEVLYGPGHDSRLLKPLCISNDGATLIKVKERVGDTDEFSSFLTLYDPKEKVWRNVTMHCVSEAITYVQTLVSPLTGTGK